MREAHILIRGCPCWQCLVHLHSQFGLFPVTVILPPPNPHWGGLCSLTHGMHIAVPNPSPSLPGSAHSDCVGNPLAPTSTAYNWTSYLCVHMWPQRSSHFAILYSWLSVICGSNGTVISMMIITIRDWDHATMPRHCWYSEMFLGYCSPPLISAAIFQSLAPSKIYQYYDIFVLNDGLSPSSMKLTILWHELRDTVALFWVTSIISTSCLSTLLWHHVYLPLLSAMEHPDMTCASVPGFSHNKHFPSLDSPCCARCVLVGSWSYVVCMACVSCLSDMCHIFDQVNHHDVAASHMVQAPCSGCWIAIAICFSSSKLHICSATSCFLWWLLAFDHHGFPMGRYPMPFWWLCTAHISFQFLSAVIFLPIVTSTFHFLPVLVLISWLQMFLSDESDSVMCCWHFANLFSFTSDMNGRFSMEDLLCRPNVHSPGGNANQVLIALFSFISIFSTVDKGML